MYRWVKENKSITYIEQEINTKIESDKILQDATNNLKSEDIYNTAWCKPLYLLIEYELTDNSKLSFIELSKDLHLEHILPKKYKNFKEWNHISDEVAYEWINSAGNLTLLSGTKNIEASNNPFSEKINVYKGKGRYDNKNNSITAFEMTKYIVDDYSSKKYDEEWTINAMEDRYDWFCNNVEKIINININIKERKEKKE